MEKFTRLESVAAPLRRANIDTDQIIPMRYLVTATREGLGRGLFADWRYRPDGSEDPDFVLNRPTYRGARILVAGANFGCGSSREHAPWALLDFGVRAVIAPGFASIFHDNAGKNGILLVTLSESEVDALLGELETAQPRMVVDLAAEQLLTPSGRVVPFRIDARRRAALLAGQDEIGATLVHETRIAQFQAADRMRRPWIHR
jgi:3-isopropylmalate/(R)-2-methylmalate dehydratase small subunit